MQQKFTLLQSFNNLCQIKKLFHEHNFMFYNIFKLKHLMQKGFIVQDSKLLYESFKILRESIFRIMNCQEVKIYLIDEEKKTPFSKKTLNQLAIVEFVDETKQILDLKKAKYILDFNLIKAALKIDNLKILWSYVYLEKRTIQYSYFNSIYSEEKESSQFQFLSEWMIFLQCYQSQLIDDYCKQIQTCSRKQYLTYIEKSQTKFIFNYFYTFFLFLQQISSGLTLKFVDLYNNLHHL
ncbi:unnamed protein product [Paramecium sonneborni]|uniref:Uncharacterized protein n=1 Tax=Paramecium sonneborni TaxID=65129 RepID=A0A8S1L5D2_9CILI|nr:unnamed protein product [Paramecium sonneborni]